MNTVERVIQICNEQNIPISKLESDLGFGNRYIKGLKKGVLPNDRLEKIANYLNVSTHYLSTGGENNVRSEFSLEQSELDLKISKDIELKNALKKYFSLSEEKKKHIVEMIKLLSGDEKL